jgi:hypothetical protein
MLLVLLGKEITLYNNFIITNVSEYFMNDDGSEDTTRKNPADKENYLYLQTPLDQAQIKVTLSYNFFNNGLLVLGRVLVFLKTLNLKKDEQVIIIEAPENISPDHSILLGKYNNTPARVTIKLTPLFDLEYKLNNPKSSELKDLPDECDIVVIGKIF